MQDHRACGGLFVNTHTRYRQSEIRHADCIKRAVQGYYN